MASPVDQLNSKAVLWNVTINQTRETFTSLLGFGLRGAMPVVLKITKQYGDESHSGKVLQAFAGDGAVRVHESDIGAVLMERLDPGHELTELVFDDRDEEATRILATVIGKLANHRAPEECPTVADWGKGFTKYQNTGNTQIPYVLVDKARELYERLTSSQRRTMLLHGDLQHYNVLSTSERGWVAIDPKGVVGELEYEVGPILRNPVESPEVFATRSIVERRLKILTTIL